MKMDDTDRDLAAGFAALREEDRRVAPALATLLSRPRSRPHGLPLWRPALAAAAVATALAGIGWLAGTAEPPPTREAEVASLLAWRSPTGSLLVTPGRELLAAPSTLGSAVLPDRLVGPSGPKGPASRSLTGRKEIAP